MRKRIFKVEGFEYKMGSKKDAQYFVNRILRAGYKIKVEFGFIEDNETEFCEMKILTSKG